MEALYFDKTYSTKVLDVTLIEPRLKHSTIFGLYEDLNERESLVIKNDHDPRPLHYQFLAEKGEKAFSWEYIENGPETWIVRITKKRREKK